jgi:hypothetical protein
MLFFKIVWDTCFSRRVCNDSPQGQYPLVAYGLLAAAANAPYLDNQTVKI